MTLRRGWSAVSLSLGGDRGAVHDAAPGEPPELDFAAMSMLVRPRARRGFWFAWSIATTAALATVAAFWLWPRTSEVAQTSAQHHRPAARSDVLPPGARRLTLEGGVEAVLAQSSVMRIEDGAPRVEGGEVRFSVPKRPPGHPFVVRAEGYRVVVVGTRFGVNVDGKGEPQGVGVAQPDGKTSPAGSKRVDVDVDEGIVEVWETANGQRLARLTPGERWQSPDVAPEPAAPAAPATSAEIVPAPAATTAEPPAPQAVRSHHPGKHAGGGRTLALASPGDDVSSRERAAAETPTGEAAAARAALASGDANRALQLYKTLAQGTGPSAENAAYEIGKVLNEKMGQPQSAVAAWRRYRAANPEGILRVEADVSIIETLGRIGESDEALSEANEFLRRHPDSERRAEIARLAGDLYRARGDCRHALPAYQIAVGASRPRDAVEAAAFHRADCLVRLGDAGGADAARAYLRAYPNGKFRGEAAALTSGSAPRP
jgi:tetratricopeptide (TPR) repeat protein